MTILDQCTELLSRLVACPSVNPSRRPVSGPPYGEARLVAMLADLLRSWGARVILHEILPDRPNLTATFPGAADSPSLLLEAHSDTVEPDPAMQNPFAPAIRGNRLYGRGACDTKASMAAMLIAIRQILDERGQMPAIVHFAACCDEEGGASGAAHFLQQGIPVDAALVGEPTDLRIIHAHKGVIRLRLTTRGLAAHSSDPSRGINAIDRMVPVLEALLRTVQPALAQLRHPLLGSPTLSVGTIHGGTQINVVPARCAIEIDRRLIPGETREGALRQVLDAVGDHADIVADTLEYYPSLETPTDSVFARLVSRAAASALGEARLGVAPWASDAGVFAAGGIPSLLFGPGSIAQAHTADEYVDLDQVATSVAVYAEVIRQFADIRA